MQTSERQLRPGPSKKSYTGASWLLSLERLSVLSISERNLISDDARPDTFVYKNTSVSLEAVWESHG